MARKTQGNPAAAPVAEAPEVTCEHRPTFDVFIIDTGWNLTVSRALKQNLGLIQDYLSEHNLYVLSTEQSVEILKREAAFIGNDPIVLFLDGEAPNVLGRRTGFRLNLGLLRHAEQAQAKLMHALKIVAQHKTCDDFSATIRRELRRAGIDGAFKALGESALELH